MKVKRHIPHFNGNVTRKSCCAEPRSFKQNCQMKVNLQYIIIQSTEFFFMILQSTTNYTSEKLHVLMQSNVIIEFSITNTK
jgi:hypothetical protein